MGLGKRVVEWLSGRGLQENDKTRGGLPPSLRRKYKILRHICTGGSGNVWLCVDKRTGRHVACKVVESADSLPLCSDSKTSSKNPTLTFLDTETEIMFRLMAFGHKGIVGVREVHQEYSKTVFVMDYCEGGDLFDLIRNLGALPEDLSRSIFRQVAEALQYVHALGIVHRDIKAENVLLTNNPENPGVPEAKLADFGLGAILSNGRKETCAAVGTKFWAAPEVRGENLYGMKVDVWSLGVLLFCMLTGKLPRNPGKSEPDELWRSFLMGKPKFYLASQWKHAPEEARDLLRKMLEKDPEKRVSLAQVLVHPWLHETSSSNDDADSRDELAGELALRHKIKHLRVEVDDRDCSSSTLGASTATPSSISTVSSSPWTPEIYKCRTSWS